MLTNLPKILILSLGCKNDHYLPINDAARNTWLTKSPTNIKTVFLYGGKEIFYDGLNSFYVDQEEHYGLMLYKTICAFEFFLKNYEFDYIFRCNETGYFDLENMNKFIQDKPLNNFYCGIVGELNGDLFASGSGFFISKDVVLKLVENKNSLDYNYNFEDVFLGRFIIKNLKIDIHPSARRIDLDPNIIPDDLDMTHYHYRIVHGGSASALYKIHQLKYNTLD
jgi:hypothetical protein